jgi:hypothetical protein
MLEEFGKLSSLKGNAAKHTCWFRDYSHVRIILIHLSLVRLSRSMDFLERAQAPFSSSKDPSTYLTQRKPLGRAREKSRATQQLVTLVSRLG